MYDNLRKPLFEHCLALKQNFDYYNDQEKFIFIMNTDYLQIILAKVVSQAEEIRLTLIENHENHWLSNILSLPVYYNYATFK